MKKLKMHSKDTVQDNVSRIQDLFPDCVTKVLDPNTGQVHLSVDIEQLKGALGEGSYVEGGGGEFYQLSWLGKAKAIALGSNPTSSTLRPSAPDSVDFEHTKNLFIEGDNLEALKAIQKSYFGKIKMIFIDPPYNTGKDFIYRDNFSMNASDYLASTRQVSDDGNRLVANPVASGRFHSEWLSMIYPRLRLAKSLLSMDGVMAVHIDENEYANLEKIMTEIFGESNNLGTIVWDKRNPKGNVTRVSQQHEYILMFARDYLTFKDTVDFQCPKDNAEKMIDKAQAIISTEGSVNEASRKKFGKWLKDQDFPEGEKAYKKLDDDGEIYQPVSMASPDKNNTDDRYAIPLVHPKTGKPCPVPANGWRYKPETMKYYLDQDQIVFGKDESTQPRRKYLLKDNMKRAVPSIIYFGGSDDDLFKNLNMKFDNPKPVYISKMLISSVCSGDDIVLDFFAGSSTTAHAVMELNSEDGHNIRFIMIQYPEKIKSKAFSCNGKFKTISDLSKERIRLAGSMVSAGDVHDNWTQDVGFRVLKVASSNMKDVYYRPSEVKQSDLLEMAENVKRDRTSEDLLFQVMLDRGIDLAAEVQRDISQGSDIFFVDDGALVACFDKGLGEDLVKYIATHERKPRYVVFRDQSFATDSDRVNVEQIFNEHSPATEIGVI